MPKESSTACCCCCCCCSCAAWGVCAAAAGGGAVRRRRVSAGHLDVARLADLADLLVLAAGCLLVEDCLALREGHAEDAASEGPGDALHLAGDLEPGDGAE